VLLCHFILALTPALALAIPAPEPAPRVSFALAIFNPFVIQEADGHLRGIYQEYLAELIQRSGLEPRFETMPLNRVLHHASKGTYDFFMGISGTPEADSNYLEVARFHKMKVILIGLTKKLNFNDGPIVIGKAPDTNCPLFTKEQEKKIRYYEYTNTPQAVKMMSAKRINALCTTRELFHFEIQQSQYANWSFSELSDFHHEFVVSLFANKRIHPDKIKSVSRAVAELDQKKILTNLYKKYGLEEPARP
jgi:hypothetical protein